jgi:hypothetical protein
MTLYDAFKNKRTDFFTVVMASFSQQTART